MYWIRELLHVEIQLKVIHDLLTRKQLSSIMPVITSIKE